MSSEAGMSRHRPLTIHIIPDLGLTKVRPIQRLWRQSDGESTQGSIERGDSQARAVDAYAIPDGAVAQDRPRLVEREREALLGGHGGDGGDAREVLDLACVSVCQIGFRRRDSLTRPVNMLRASLLLGERIEGFPDFY
jgi:hypothetical protein